MAWADLEWPDLSPAFPQPRPAPAPPRPNVPAGIAAQVERAERRRGVFVPLCALAGAALFCSGVGVYHFSAAIGHAAGETSLAPTPLALAVMMVGLLVATLVPALVVLLVIGPSWRQRQQHLALIGWERERREWLARERQRYLASLSEATRRQLLAQIREREPGEDNCLPDAPMAARE